MPVHVRIELPATAVEKLMDGYRRGDPRIMALLQEFCVLSIHSHEEHSLGVWENEGGKC
jgi:hypothetical protein